MPNKIVAFVVKEKVRSGALKWVLQASSHGFIFETEGCLHEESDTLFSKVCFISDVRKHKEL